MSDVTKEQTKPRGEGREITPLVVNDVGRARPYYIPSSRDAYNALIGITHFIVQRRLIKDHGSWEVSEVIATLQHDLEERSEMGRQKYGETLRAFNGRDAQLDLYQELLDALKYFRQMIEELETNKN